MSARDPYRAPQRPSRRRSQVVRSADPPEDPDAEARRAQRETGKLLAAQIAEEARERKRQERSWRWFRVLADILRSVVPW